MEVTSFITKDGSSIREFAHTSVQSLAEATVEVGRQTEEHYHRNSEELYLFTSGMGRMRLGDEERDVTEGDCVVIPPGAEHKIWADEAAPLVLLCACAPAYSDEDTVLTEEF